MEIKEISLHTDEQKIFFGDNLVVKFIFGGSKLEKVLANVKLCSYQTFPCALKAEMKTTVIMAE